MRKVLVILTVFLLVGCGSMVDKQTIVQTKPVGIPNSFFITPTNPKPIDKEKYIGLSNFEKEKELTLYIISLLSVIKEYELILYSIREYVDKQERVISELNKEGQ